MDELLQAAGHVPASAPQATFDQPWPIDALGPIQFERFCTYFLADLYPGATVHRYGDQGHKQHGLDIEVIFPDQRIFTFQCKRHTAFGPGKIDTAVKEHTREAERKVILLSSVASTQARDAIRKHHGWKLWDREDISRVIRQDLPKARQRRLVDVFFAGQHRALIGEFDASPWYTPDAFFASTPQIGRAFSHSWELVGREVELEQLFDFARNAMLPVGLLIANGGAGKSRLLKALADRIAKARLPLDVYFLSRDSLTTRSLDELGARPKLLVCDDAHDREDLAMLFDYVADPSKQAHIIVSLRPYGLERVKREARALSGSEMVSISLPRMTQSDSELLARQALKQFGGSEAQAGRLAMLTRDCPLATVIGAEVISTSKKLPPEFLFSEENFRDELLRRLVLGIVGGASNGMNADTMRVTLAAISLLQPIKGEDSALTDALAQIAGVKSYEIARITRRLIDAGVLFERGFSRRIAPDLLADFIMEQECITHLGQSTGFAESVFDAVPGAYVEHILSNLGRLDWIKSNGDTRQSQLLDALWQRVSGNYVGNPAYMRAAISVAFYQPNQALDFAVELLRSGVERESAARIISNAAHTYHCLPKACRLLWDMGQHDQRALGSNPYHPVRILAELVTPKPNNPIAYIECIVDFALSLLPDEGSWTSSHTPLEILIGALATEGHTTTSTHREMKMSAFSVSGKNMTGLRRKIVSACIEMLSSPQTSRGYRAAGMLESALRFPIGLFNTSISTEGRDQWIDEFCWTLNEIDAHLEKWEFSPVVFNRVAHAVSWHAKYFDGATNELARRVMAKAGNDLCFRTINFLMGGWGRVISEVGDEYSIDKREQVLNDLMENIVAAFPAPADLWSFLDARLREIADAKADLESAPFPLVSHIIRSSIGLAKVIIENLDIEGASSVIRFAGTALAKLLHDDPAYAKGIVLSYLDATDTARVLILSEAYGQYRPRDKYSDTDVRVLRRIVTCDSRQILLQGAQTVGLVVSVDHAFAVELLCVANMSVHSDVADSFLMWLCNSHAISFESLAEAQLQAVLHNLVYLQTLEEYWIQEFLGEAIRSHTGTMIEFFKLRIAYVQEGDHWHYRPIPYGPFRRKTFDFMKLPESTVWLSHLFEWARAESDDVGFQYQFAHLIQGLCAPFDSDFFSYMEKFVDCGTAGDFELVITILGEADHSIVFDQEAFVIRFLRRAKSFDAELLEHATRALHASATSGVRSGVPGKPFARDLKIRDAVEGVLSRIGRFEPAYELYDTLLQEAKFDIERQEKIGRAMDDEER